MNDFSRIVGTFVNNFANCFEQKINKKMYEKHARPGGIKGEKERLELISVCVVIKFESSSS